MMQDIFFFFMLAIIVTGGYCAYRLDAGYPLWLRLLVLSPVFGALCGVYHISTGEFIANPPDIAMAFGLIGVYIGIANALSHNDSRWLRKWHNTGRAA